MMRIGACIGTVILLSFTAFGQSTEKPPAFEIADVHSSAETLQPQMSGGTPRDGRFEIRTATMVDLIRTAYGVTAEKVTGGPNWLASDRFDVIAKVAPGVTAEQARLMLRTLLADRFGLKLHNDTKPLPVFVLSLGKGKHKLKESDGTKNGCQGQPQQAQPGVVPQQVVNCYNLTSAQIAENLRMMANAYLDKTVIDETKLEGKWDFELKWTGRGQLAAAGADGISVFDAVDKQLGLKLEPQQVASAVLTIDSVNRKPTDNLPGVAEALPPEKPEFEAADIKPVEPGSPQGVGIRYSLGGRIDAIGSIRDFIVMSMQLPPNLAADLIVGGPKSIETDRYQILAKTPSTGIGAPDRSGGREIAPPIGVALMMLRALLEDRFKLKTHQEERQSTVYAILPPKGDLKMKKADPSERAGCSADQASIPKTPGATMAYTCVNTTMKELAKNIQQWAPAYFDHPAVDASGLEGGWNFTLAWTGRGVLEGGGGNRGGDGAPAGGGGGAALDPTGGLSVFQAIERQLGLKVEKGTHALTVTVIDHIEPKPTEQ